jgi:hypothetical protein
MIFSRDFIVGRRRLHTELFILIGSVGTLWKLLYYLQNNPVNFVIKVCKSFCEVFFINTITLNRCYAYICKVIIV